MNHDQADELCSAISAGDAGAARSAAAEALDAGASGAVLIREWLAPALRAAGAKWQRNEWTVAQEHLATAAADAALALIEFETPVPPAGAPLVAVACVDGEWHSLAARMATQLMREAGLRAVFLGGSIPPPHLGEHLVNMAPDVVAVSATLGWSLPGAARTIDAARLCGAMVVAGGAAFGSTPDRARALGADLWLADPAELAGVLSGHRCAQPRRPIQHVAVPPVAVTGPLARDLVALPGVMEAAYVAADPTVVTDYHRWARDALGHRAVDPADVDAAFLSYAQSVDADVADWITSAVSG